MARRTATMTRMEVMSTTIFGIYQRVSACAEKLVHTGDNTKPREDTHRGDDAAHARTQALEVLIGPRVASLW
jgi:hypothetical protein